MGERNTTNRISNDRCSAQNKTRKFPVNVRTLEHPVPVGSVRCVCRSYRIASAPIRNLIIDKGQRFDVHAFVIKLAIRADNDTIIGRRVIALDRAKNKAHDI